MEQQEENLNEFPAINAAGKKHLFKAPEGYFEQLPHEISEKIYQPIPARTNPIPRLVVLSLVIVGAVLLVVNITNKKETIETITAFDVTSDHIIEAGYLSDMDESLLMESIVAHDIDIEIVEGESTEMQDFLIENRTDINLIINEL